MTRYVDDAPLTVDEDNAKQQTGMYRAMIISVAAVFVVLAWFTLRRLHRAVRDIRSAFRPTFRRIARISFLVLILILGIIFLVNVLGKQKEWNKK